MVNRSRGQSQEAPSFLSWPMMVPPDFSFHCHTRFRNSPRPSVSRDVPSAWSCRSTTF